MLIVIFVVWAIWAFVASLGLRYALKRWVFRMEREWVSYACSYAAMAGLLLAAMWFVDFSGWGFKSLNREPLQQIGAFVLLYSPFGLPLLIGGPMVMFYDGVQAVRRSEGYIE